MTNSKTKNVLFYTGQGLGHKPADNYIQKLRIDISLEHIATLHNQ